MTRWTIAAVVIAVLATLAVAVAWTLDPTRALIGGLMAVYTAYTTAIGALLLVLISDATDAVWLPVLRRPAEAIVSILPLLAMLFVPLLLSLGRIYSWAPDGLPLSAHDEELVSRKRAWLNEPFFVMRSAAYLLVPVFVGELVRARSRYAARAKRQRTAAVGLPIVILVATFAGFDWVMSLEPGYYSTAFGLIPTTGGFMAALSLLIIIVAVSQRRGALIDVGPDHIHALGKLLLTSVCFWAYLMFFQFMLGWIANLPFEARWYLPRTTGGWGLIALVLVGFHFVLPFFALLSRSLKRSASALAVVSSGLLFVHWLDVYWLTVPAVRHDAPSFHVSDLASAVAVFCSGYALAMWRTVRASPTPIPLFERSLRYRSE